eukprot:3091371-Karenia_brevis.AAC.1
MAVPPFLHALSLIEGVRAVFGFCDDWEISMVGIRPARLVRTLVEEFEAASGQVVHRVKSKWLACRPLTAAERRSLSQARPGAELVEKQLVLGTLLGHGVDVAAFIQTPLSKFFERLRLYACVPMSLAMRIMTANIYILPVLSYICRIVLLPPDILRHIEHSLLRFLTPVPFCRLQMFTQMQPLLRTRLQLRDVHLDNIAAVLANACCLHGMGIFSQRIYDSWKAGLRN